MGFHYPGFTDCYVDLTNGNDSNSGFDWDNAFATIGKVIAVSRGSAIHIAAGTYAENIELDNNLTLLGGYPAGGGDRAPSANKTIIDGGAVDTVVMIMGKTDVMIDGFTIRNGIATYGGGVYGEASSAELSNCIVTDHTAEVGGGMFFYDGSSVHLLNCLIAHNSANYGASALCYWDCALDMVSCRVADNTADWVGGICCDGASELAPLNSILFGNSGHQVYGFAMNNTFDITYSCVEGAIRGLGTSIMIRDLCRRPTRHSTIISHTLAHRPGIPRASTPATAMLRTRASKGERLVLTGAKTGAEIDCAGFALFREVAGTRDYQLSDLIPAQGTSSDDASYSLVDWDVERGVTYNYWLVDVETSGELAAELATVLPKSDKRLVVYSLNERFEIDSTSVGYLGIHPFFVFLTGRDLTMALFRDFFLDGEWLIEPDWEHIYVVERGCDAFHLRSDIKLALIEKMAGYRAEAPTELHFSPSTTPQSGGGRLAACGVGPDGICIELRELMLDPILYDRVRVRFRQPLDRPGSSIVLMWFGSNAEDTPLGSQQISLSGEQLVFNLRVEPEWLTASSIRTLRLYLGSVSQSEALQLISIDREPFVLSASSAKPLLPLAIDASSLRRRGALKTAD
ncbi:right-handed parallel beta-helix repeat-containing protein [bacterium]|nr:right-handed parallel beta-helix repeat-containing protein [bacterium]